MKPYYERAAELYEQGLKSATQIARQLIHEGLAKEPFDRVRRNVSHNVTEKDNLLSKECGDLGIPIENVKHYWHKGKHFSINVGTNSKMSYDDLRESIIEDMNAHAPSYPKLIRIQDDSEGYLLVMDPADIHIGKLASALRPEKIITIRLLLIELSRESMAFSISVPDLRLTRSYLLVETTYCI